MKRSRPQEEEQSESESEPPQKKGPDFRRNAALQSPLDSLVINLSDCQYKIVAEAAKGLGFTLCYQQHAADWDLYWTDNFIEGELLMKMCQFQKVSHFPGVEHLTRKNLMARALTLMQRRFPTDYQFFPRTWILPSEYNQFRLHYEDCEKGRRKTYIVKPEAGCQGRGIFLTRDIQQVEGGSHFVVQRYLSQPMLIDGLKFDLRLYVLLKSVSPLKIYLFKEGLARFATRKFQAPRQDNLSDLFMHLTNYSVNKANPSFVYNRSQFRTDVGHKRSFSSVLQILRKAGHPIQLLLWEIEKVVTKAMLACCPPLTHQYRAFQPRNLEADMCFHVLGVDIILNNKCSPFLLQINHTPSFTTDTPLDRMVKGSLIRDTLRLLGFSLDRKQKIINQHLAFIEKRHAGKSKTAVGPSLSKLRAVSLTEDDKAVLGGFRRIYPCKDPELMRAYDQFYKFAEKQYLESKGFKRRFWDHQLSKPEGKDIGPKTLALPKERVRVVSRTRSAGMGGRRSQPQLCEQQRREVGKVPQQEGPKQKSQPTNAGRMTQSWVPTSKKQLVSHLAILPSCLSIAKVRRQPRA